MLKIVVLLFVGHGSIGAQMGSHKGASQAGMSMGGIRHVSDMDTGEMDKTGQSVIGLQMGSNKGASQAGKFRGPMTPYTPPFGRLAGITGVNGSSWK